MYFICTLYSIKHQMMSTFEGESNFWIIRGSSHWKYGKNNDIWDFLQSPTTTMRADGGEGGGINTLFIFFLLSYRVKYEMSYRMTFFQVEEMIILRSRMRITFFSYYTSLDQLFIKSIPSLFFSLSLSLQIMIDLRMFLLLCLRLRMISV